MKRTMTRRFYVGSSNFSNTIENNGSHPLVTTLADAITSAKKKINDDITDVVYIVEIIKIVRRIPPKLPEVIIEDVI